MFHQKMHFQTKIGTQPNTQTLCTQTIGKCATKIKREGVLSELTLTHEVEALPGLEAEAAPGVEATLHPA